jgi:hypothetical protein
VLVLVLLHNHNQRSAGIQEKAAAIADVLCTQSPSRGGARYRGQEARAAIDKPSLPQRSTAALGRAMGEGGGI